MAMPDSTFWLTLAVLGVAVALSVVQGRAKDQLGRVERKLDLLLKDAQIDLAAVADREAAALVRAGSKIQAIRVYRELTGTGLAEAKEAVERLERGEAGGAPGPG
jgi:ribosomal protein L7/L12